MNHELPASIGQIAAPETKVVSPLARGQIVWMAIGETFFATSFWIALGLWIAGGTDLGVDAFNGVVLFGFAAGFTIAAVGSVRRALRGGIYVSPDGVRLVFGYSSTPISWRNLEVRLARGGDGWTRMELFDSESGRRFTNGSWCAGPQAGAADVQWLQGCSEGLLRLKEDAT